MDASLRPDPYTWAKVRSWRNRVARQGVGAVARALLLPLVSAALLIPLVRVVLLSWLDGPRELWGQGLEAVLLRIGIGILGWVSLDLHAALIRGPDRDVLALLPVDAGAVARSVMLTTGVADLWLVGLAALLLAPIALAGAPALWAAGVVALASIYALSVAVGAATHLLAVLLADDPRFAPLLDAIRGPNPRPQAAFLYGPGTALLVVGVLLVKSGAGAAAVATAASGAGTAGAGVVSGVLWLVAPWVAAAGIAAVVPALSRAAWFRGSAVLAEIDGHDRALSAIEREEERRVYLEWAVRFLPPKVGWWALLDLRNGWRERRTAPLGGWMLGLAAVAAALTGGAQATSRALGVSIVGCALIGAAAVLLSRDEPEFLKKTLPRGPEAPLARWLVVWAWSQPLVAAAAGAAAARGAPGDGAWVFAAGELAGAALAALGVACGRSRERGLAWYAPLAALFVGALMAAGTP